MIRVYEFADGSRCTVNTTPAQIRGTDRARRLEVVVEPGTRRTQAREFATNLVDMVDRIAGSSLITPAPLDSSAKRDAAPAHVTRETDQPQPVAVDDDGHT